MSLNPEFFRDGFLEQALGLGPKELAKVLDSVVGDEKWNLFSTELFGRMYFLNEDRDKLTDTINGYAHA